MKLSFSKVPDTYNKQFFTCIIILSILSSFRSLFIQIGGDELTYDKIANNILQGKYYLHEYPSSVTPILPFLMVLFKIKAFPMLGFALHKSFHIFLAVYGGYYAYSYFRLIQIPKNIALCLITLVAVNTNSVMWFSNLYPEAILFFCFWGFIYFSHKQPGKKHLAISLCFFVILILTRYLYAVLGVIVIINYYNYFRKFGKRGLVTLVKYSCIALIPLLLWGKYVDNIESQNLSEISYFNRFKTDNQLVYNLKCGLGLIKHYEVDKINGVPAFISLFVPKTGVRNYFISMVLILGFLIGFLYNKLILKNKLLMSLALVMLGLVFAGTGFSRYWLVLLPGFYLGYYYLYNKFVTDPIWFIRFSQLLCIIYVINELRLDVLVLNKS